MALEHYWVEHSPNTKQVRDFLKTWHYSDYVNIQHKETFTLWKSGNFGFPSLVGVCIYTRPAGPAAANKYWPSNPTQCLELRRLCLIDDTPKNAESYFVSRTLKWLKVKSNWEYVISYADPEQGHSGVIYKAANFTYGGVTGVGSQLEVDGEKYHIRTLTMLDREYGRKINERYKNKDPNIKITKTLPKHIYTYNIETKRSRRKS
jgi:hypothetical protein